MRDRLDFLGNTAGHFRDRGLLLRVLLSVVSAVHSRVLEINKGEVVCENEKSPGLSILASLFFFCFFDFHYSPFNSRNNDQCL